MSRLIALRLPDDLAAKLDSRCSIRKVSATRVLLDAIQRGWEGPVDQSAERGTHNAKVSGSIPDRPTIDHLRAICAGNIPKQPDPEPAEDVTPRCCECDYHLIGKAIKGRGIVWACSNVGCAMYGREQRQR